MRVFPKKSFSTKLVNFFIVNAIAANVFFCGLFTLIATTSLAHAAEALEMRAESVWLDTDTLDNTDVEARLAEYDAIWCGTSSPYRSMQGALRAIRFARERGVPFIGT